MDLCKDLSTGKFKISNIEIRSLFYPQQEGTYEICHEISKSYVTINGVFVGRHVSKSRDRYQSYIPNQPTLYTF